MKGICNEVLNEDLWIISFIPTHAQFYKLSKHQFTLILKTLKTF
jgi:hypothetical protein